jgi:hypothetical protein
MAGSSAAGSSAAGSSAGAAGSSGIAGSSGAAPPPQAAKSMLETTSKLNSIKIDLRMFLLLLDYCLSYTFNVWRDLRTIAQVFLCLIRVDGRPAFFIQVDLQSPPFIFSVTTSKVLIIVFQYITG